MGPSQSWLDLTAPKAASMHSKQMNPREGHLPGRFIIDKQNGW
jgi:hypothetical protein